MGQFRNQRNNTKLNMTINGNLSYHKSISFPLHKIVEINYDHISGNLITINILFTDSLS